MHKTGKLMMSIEKMYRGEYFLKEKFDGEFDAKFDDPNELIITDHIEKIECDSIQARINVHDNK